ncbi:MAG: hypothetical protein ABI759_16535 [Candidatus Solibacter sp.]
MVVLQRDGYLVLESRDEDEAMDIIRLHSRPIHLMLIDESAYGRELAARLNQYRPQMQVVFVDWDARQNVCLKVKEILGPLQAGDRLPEIKPATDAAERAPLVRRRSA